MDSFPLKNDIIASVILGIKTAKDNFSNWTCDELYLSYAPSKFLSIHVSQEIAKLNNAPEIFIDATVADILRCSLPKRDAFREFMQKNYLSPETISLTLDERFEHQTDNDSVSRVIMSIQNGVRNVKDEYRNEIHKMCKMLNRNKKEDSSLDYGLFAFYLDISSSARKKAATRLDEITEAFAAIVSEYNNLKSDFKGGEIKSMINIGEWSVGCFIIEPTFK